ncbi:MAG: RecQ family ATP-dependent DNA helicase [Flavobacteriaceae bacterium]|nr:RecQ family ATP-dependent DNA helicase [Flavobacteriaceae bacterium]MBL6678927.1 RecQ family ATP-dependent DNA helicase [Flavobacteriaceae bacterium]
MKLSLKKHFGFNEFKNHQESVIKNLLEGNDSFVIMPTGGGKSLCYQLPALIMDGTAIVISPLIALMKNQVDLLRASSTDHSIAHVLNSTLTKQQVLNVKEDVVNNKTKLLYIAPETLSKNETIDFLKSIKISFLAIDEAHCISEWGHDFRPEYRKIREIIELIDTELKIVALTATATPKVQDDIVKNLKIHNSKVFKSSFNRPNLFYEVRGKNEATDLDLIKFIKSKSNQSGIIYCLSRKKVEDLSELLNINGINSLPYHAGLEKKNREENQDRFLNDDCSIIVATIAFGMGIDKPDVRFVVHYDVPKSIEGYYQETGRAGRDGVVSHCIMYYSDEDAEKLEKLLSQKKSSEREVGIMLLKEVKSFAKSSISRRKYLLSYFGEKYDSNVHNDSSMDDNSKNPKEKINAIEKLKFLISNFFNSNKKISFKKLVNTLPVQEENQISRDFWKTLITHCIVDGILIRDINDIGSLKITDYGKQFLNNQDKFDISIDNDFSVENKPKYTNFKTGVIDTDLMAKLIILRKDIAKKNSLPPYAILQEFSLEDMTYKYPTSLEEFKNINGVGDGKVNKFGNYFIKLIKEYIEENKIQKPDDLVLRTSGEKSSKKLSLIQNIDKKIPLDEISDSRGIEFTELLSELESIVFSGTKLDIDYYLEEILDEEQQEELKEYFLESESEDISDALEEFDGDYDEEELRLYRIKFLNDVSN